MLQSTHRACRGRLSLMRDGKSRLERKDELAKKQADAAAAKIAAQEAAKAEKAEAAAAAAAR